MEKMQNFDEASSKEQKRAERLANVRRVFDFLNLKEKEKLLFITDNVPYNTDREFIDLMKAELANKGNEFSEFTADDKKTKLNELLETVAGNDVIWNSWGMEETKVSFDKLADAITERGGRLAHCPGLKAKHLDDDGALAEDKEELDYRLAKMEAKLKDVAGFQIESAYGTKLEVKMKPGERRWFKENGELKPGSWGNLPAGEIFTTPDETEVNGVLVLPVLSDDVSKYQGVDELVYLTIRGGKIAKIDGGQSAEKLRKCLQDSSKDEKDPLSVLQIAEIAFGANAKAGAAVTKPAGSFRALANPTVETEKRLGTMHLAFGDSRHGEEGTEGYNKSEIHLDFVLPRNGLTVKAFYSREDFKKGKNGQRLIDEGRWNFIE